MKVGLIGSIDNIRDRNRIEIAAVGGRVLTPLSQLNDP
jgi:hypothetical protein